MSKNDKEQAPSATYVVVYPTYKALVKGIRNHAGLKLLREIIAERAAKKREKRAAEIRRIAKLPEWRQLQRLGTEGIFNAKRW